MKTLIYWKNIKILITGGTSGLGRALAKQLVAAGAAVAVLGRDKAKLLALKEEHPEIKIIQGDISVKEDIHRIYSEAIEKLGDIDVLFNNASSLGPVPLRLLIDTDCEDFSRALETNVMGAFRLTKLVLPSMILKRTGVVVNISSDAAIQNYPTWGAYSISKSALDHLTALFAAELEKTGVRFLAVDPGDMNTELHRTAVPDANPEGLFTPEDSAMRLLHLLETEKYSAAHRGLR